MDSCAIIQTNTTAWSSACRFLEHETQYIIERFTCFASVVSTELGTRSVQRTRSTARTWWLDIVVASSCVGKRRRRWPGVEQQILQKRRKKQLLYSLIFSISPRTKRIITRNINEKLQHSWERWESEPFEVYYFTCKWTFVGRLPTAMNLYWFWSGSIEGQSRVKQIKRRRILL
jgi:hypothetical protein